MPTQHDLIVPNLGPCQIESPLKAKGRTFLDEAVRVRFENEVVDFSLPVGESTVGRVGAGQIAAVVAETGADIHHHQFPFATGTDVLVVVEGRRVIARTDDCRKTMTFRTTVPEGCVDGPVHNTFTHPGTDGLCGASVACHRGRHRPSQERDLALIFDDSEFANEAAEVLDCK